ncbi:doublecortin domain-containing protein 2B isoform X1 [Apteryx rowi]|uniref:doublecortin domain-containing protein 2B isoform X1 n=1 Tax=Apteryx rowi TaxID=308060 RepID=UPI000E1DBA9B|nr:doublecortin domain-containing protein 2B isoform X1 [Apteryx rowi]
MFCSLIDVVSGLAHNFLLLGLQPWRRPVAPGAVLRREAEHKGTWSEGFWLSVRLGRALLAPRWSFYLSGQRSLLDPQVMSSRGLALAPPAKNVVVYRNGDPFFHGRKIVVNQRQFLTFEAFLNEVTKSISAPLAVRNLYTPRQGHRVAELGDLQDGCQYVAAGFERFKRLNYLNRGMKQLSETRNSNGMQPRTVAPWKQNISSRWQKHTHLPCMIHVFRNGDLLSPPFRLLLSRSTLLEWDTLLTVLTGKANLGSGAVHKLCRLDGTQVSGGEELVNGGYYVAVGAEKYKNLPYFELLVPQTSANGTLWNHPNSRRKNYSKRFGKLYTASRDRASDSALAFPPQQLDCRRVQTTEATEKDKIPVTFPPLHKQARKSHLQEEESVFHAKPVRAGQNRRSNTNVQHWPDQEGSVYKAKDPRKEMRGAKEVKEDEHTKLEVPIDQRVAETVEEFIQKAKMRNHDKVWSTDKSQKTMAMQRYASDSRMKSTE